MSHAQSEGKTHNKAPRAGQNGSRTKGASGASPFQGLPPSDPALQDLVNAHRAPLRPHFAHVRAEYAANRGRLLEEYYGDKNGVTVLENKPGRKPEYRLELEFAFGNSDARLEDLVRSGRIEERRWTTVLDGKPLLTVERAIFTWLVSVMSFAEYTQTAVSQNGNLEEKIVITVASAKRELQAISALARKMAQKNTLLLYLLGMPWGLVIVAGLGFGITTYRYSIGDLGQNWQLMYCVVAGATGAVISVMVRITNGERVEIDLDQGPKMTIMIGAFRPIIGGIFGAVLYVFIFAGLVPFSPPAGKDATLFYCGVAFLAGFSERWAQDTIVHNAPKGPTPPALPA
jgi:hypothetical protein